MHSTASCVNVLVSVLVAVSLAHSPVAWHELFPRSPLDSDAYPAVRYHSGVDFLNENELFVSGGYRYADNRAQWFDDLWAFRLDEGRWRRISTGDGPTARYQHTLTRFGALLLVLVGGDDGGHRRASASASYVSGSFLDDVWTYRSSGPRGWTQLRPVQPGDAQRVQRSSHSTVFDPHSNSLLVFGGLVRSNAWTEHAAQAPPGRVSERLIEDTSSFVRVQITAQGEFTAVPIVVATAAQPVARYGHAASHCGLTHGMVIHGGFRFITPTNPTRHARDVWQWHRGTWHDLTTREADASGPSARGHHAAVCIDADFYLFGGCACSPGCVCNNELWHFSLDTLVWTQLTPRSQWLPSLLTPSQPNARFCHSLTRTPSAQTLLLFGGESFRPYQYYNDVWQLHLSPSSPSSPSSASLLVVVSVPLVAILLFCKRCWRTVSSKRLD